MKKLFIVFIVFSLIDTGKCFAQYAQWGNLKPGPYAVGYKTVRTYDYSRTYFPKIDADGNISAKENARPFQIHIWYPAEKHASAKQMKFEDYYNDAGYDQGGYISPEVLRKYHMNMVKTFLDLSSDNKTVADVWSTQVPSIRNAQPVNKKFPAVVHMGITGVLQNILLEYLASYGYVVASISVIGTNPANYGKGDGSLNGILTQTEDIAFVISQLRNEMQVDISNLAMIGMFGNIGVNLQMKEIPFKSIVLLEGTVTDNIRQQPYYDPKRLRIPVLDLISTQEPNRPYPIMDSFPYITRYKARFRKFPHADFYPWPKIARPEKSSESRNYEYAAIYAVNFLNATLKNDAAGWNFLANAPEANGMPDGDMTLTIEKGKKAIPTENEMLTWAREGNIDKLKSAYEECKRLYPGLKLFSRESMGFILVFGPRDNIPNLLDIIKIHLDAYPGDQRMVSILNTFGYNFLQQKKPEKAGEVFGFFLNQFPQSPYANNAMADYSEAIGKKEDAIAYAKKVIEFVPGSSLSESQKQNFIKEAEEKINRLKQ